MGATRHESALAIARPAAWIKLLPRRRATTRRFTAGDTVSKKNAPRAERHVGRKPLIIEAASAWSERQPPLPRDWIYQDLIPARRVTSLLGQGGEGKSTIAVQIAIHVAMGLSLWGREIKGGPVIGIFCEDEQEEIERRGRAIAAGEGIPLESLDRLYLLSRDGHDNLLCTFGRDRIALTDFYRELEATVAAIRPRLLILDTAADMYAGDFMSTAQVRQFIKIALNGLCVRYGCAVLLIAHPSSSGVKTGDGGGHSLAWSNSVRSRLYVRRHKDGSRRILETKKSNYGPDTVEILLAYRDGYFVHENETHEQCEFSARPKELSALAIAAEAYIRDTSKNGEAIAFRKIFDQLQSDGAIPMGSYENVRKILQRALGELVDRSVLVKTQVPRGCYALVPG